MGKGSSWERDVCKDLSKWIQGTEKPYLLWRQAGSGGVWTRTDGLAGEEFTGDIKSVHDKGKWLTDKWSIECKNGYKEASFDKFLKNNKSDPIKEFWVQCTRDAIQSNKQPLLIYRKKGMNPWIGFGEKSYKKLTKYVNDVRMVSLSWSKEDDLENLYFFDFKEFLDVVDFTVMKKMRFK